MKAFFRKIAKVKKRQIVKKAIGLAATGWALKYAAINANADLFGDYGQYNQRLETKYGYEKPVTIGDDEQSLTESQSVNSIRIKTGSGAMIEIQNQQNQTPEALKSALAIRSGDLGKSGPGARAKADAKANASRTGSILLPEADGYVPSQLYCLYHGNQPRSCKSIVKVSKNQFQPKDEGNNNNPPPEDGQFDASQHKGGPSLFKDFNYDNKNHTRENVDFSNQKRMNHSYDGHAEKCFGMQENRNKESLKKFEGTVQDYIQSPETERINGSYRYETPAYHYKKPDEDLIVTVNATNNEYISVRNATDFQLEKLEIDGNLGYDSRPSMSLTLRLRGPKQ